MMKKKFADIPASRHQHISNNSQTEEICGRRGQVANLSTWDDANYGDDELDVKANDGYDDLPDGTGNVQLQEP